MPLITKSSNTDSNGDQSMHFWGLCCESGKQYVQAVCNRFRITMAVLDPKSSLTENGDKTVSLIVARDDIEYLLCVLKHEEIHQVNLNLIFDKGENVKFYITGHGKVYLSGYHLIYSENNVLNDENECFCPLVEAKSTTTTNATTTRKRKLSNSSEKSESVSATPKIEKSAKVPRKAAICMDDLEQSGKNLEVSSKYSDLGSSEKRKKRDSRLSSSCIDTGNGKVEVIDFKYESDEDFLPDDSESDDDDDDDDDDKESVDEEGEELEDEEMEELADKENGEADEEEKQVVENEEKEKNNNGDDSKQSKKKLFPSQKQSINSSVIDSQNIIEKIEDGSSKKKNLFDLDPSVDSIHTPKTARNFKTSSKKKKSQKEKRLSSISNLSDDVKSVTPVAESTPNKTGNRQTLEGGVEIQDVVVGRGSPVTKGQKVHVFYVGRFQDKKIFDSRVSDRDKPFYFKLGAQQIIQGFDVGVEGMKVGGLRKIKVPPSMGFGSCKKGNIPADSTLYYTVELVSVN